MTEVTDTQHSDRERAEVVTNFERIYASLESGAEDTNVKTDASQPSTETEFVLPDFDDASFERTAKSADAAAAPEKMDLESAMALLTAGEQKSPAKEAVAPRTHARASTHGRPKKRYVLPALAGGLFVAVGAGYVAVHHERALDPAAASNAKPVTSLKLDYELENTRSDALIARSAR